MKKFENLDTGNEISEETTEEKLIASLLPEITRQIQQEIKEQGIPEHEISEALDLLKTLGAKGTDNKLRKMAIEAITDKRIKDELRRRLNEKKA